MIHIGLETVNMQGEGFETFVKPGDKVTAGTTLICFSIELIQQKGSDIVSPVVNTNPEQIRQMEITAQGEATRGETEIMKITVV